LRSAPPEAGNAREKQEDCAVARSSVCLHWNSGREIRKDSRFANVSGFLHLVSALGKW
jgi:hypothetical protein